MLQKRLGAVLVVTLLVALTACGAGNQTSGADNQAQLVSIAVTPDNASLAIDTVQQYIATGIYSDNTTRDLTASVEWSSEDPSIATVSGSPVNALSMNASSLETTSDKPGRVYAKGEGDTTINASWETVKGSGKVHVKRAKLVSIAITPTNPSIAKGTNLQVTATGTFSDNTTQNVTDTVTWSSSNTAAATISNMSGSNGLATTTAAGSTTITATAGTVSGSTTLTVNAATLVALAITPSDPSIAKGTKQQFTVIGAYSDDTTQNLTASVTWSSSNTAVATVSNSADSNGLATSTSAGSTVITATAGSVSGSTTLTVNPATLASLAITPSNPGIAKGTSQQFTATGTFSDDTTQNLTSTVVWSSSNTAVATISNAAGSNGTATSVAAGSTTIQATSGAVSTSTTLTVTPATLTSLAVTPVSSTIANGASQQFTASGSYSDSSTQNLTDAVTWSSSNTSVATISNAAGSTGSAKAVAEGSTTITAVSGGISGTSTLTVSDRSATLTWDAPTTNTDGTFLNDLAGYKIYYGTTSGNYSTTISIGKVTTHTISNLPAGTYYFAVTATNSSGAESSFSNQASKVIQ